MQYGYMGLSTPFTTQWNDGRTVTIYPDGRIQDATTGGMLRNPTPSVLLDNRASSLTPQPLQDRTLLAVLFLSSIVAIVAIVALSKR